MNVDSMYAVQEAKYNERESREEHLGNSETLIISQSKKRNVVKDFRFASTNLIYVQIIFRCVFLIPTRNPSHLEHIAVPSATTSYISPHWLNHNCFLKFRASRMTILAKFVLREYIKRP
jgi:hypothetical protein